MTFLAPWLLLALLGLPALWWLLRVTPPAPRNQSFPPARLLADLRSDQTPSRTPLWLLALRIAAAALLVIGVAGPILGQHVRGHATGLLAIVLDDDWAAASDWDMRVAAVDRLAEQAERAGRPALLLTTAPDDGAFPRVIGPMAAADLRAVLPTLRPHPWGPDHAAAAQTLATLPARPGSVAYVANGLAQDAGWGKFATALGTIGSLDVIKAAHPPAAVLSAAAAPQGWIARVAQAPGPAATKFGVRAEAADGRVLARAPLTLPAGAGSATTALTLPTELRNRVDRLTLEGPDGTSTASAAAVALLDEADRRRPVGLISPESATADTPLTGSAFFLRRALAPFSEWREGSIESLLAQPVSVLLAADRPLAPGVEADALRGWIERGGTLIRFAGPDMAQAAQDGLPDPLLPVALLPSDRQMGGSMSWGKPAALAPFPADSPFAGLTADGPGATGGRAADVAVTRQVLADPSTDLGSATWARLADGTPLVTQRALGAGRVVLFHVTANADWSNLPLSGLFVDMLRRLLALSAGVGEQGTARGDLVPTRTLDAFGGWTAPPVSARAIAAGSWPTLAVGPTHPPGLYGPQGSQAVLNLSKNQPDPVAAAALPGASEDLTDTAPPRPFGPLLVALALVLLLIDLLASLRARGLLRVAATAAVLLLACAPLQSGKAQVESGDTAPAPPPYAAALATRLAYVHTGDDTVDGIARAGLIGLSAYVNERTAAQLAPPVAVVPGHDDLSYYPLLYWPISTDAPPPDAAMVVALNGYMASGGVILIDTRDGGSGADMVSGTRELLSRLSGGPAGSGLAAPPLAALTSAHVLARSFYLLSDFPGRYDGDTVWIARDIDRSNDSVSPMIIGAHDWAAAWAVDSEGGHPFATLPGGDRQRTLAYRFGVNLVMYSLTGNYKGDQVHVPALLQRLGQ